VTTHELSCYSDPDRRVDHEHACLCVCPRPYLPNYMSDLHQIFVHLIYGRGLVFFWRHSDTLRISGFMDDIIFAHKLRLFDVATRLRQWGSHAALSVVRRNTRCMQQTFRTTSCSKAFFLTQSTDRHRTKPILVCWGNAMYMPTLIAGREAIFKFLRYKLPAY